MTESPSTPLSNLHNLRLFVAIAVAGLFAIGTLPARASTNPAASATLGSKKIVGYYPAWATYESENVQAYEVSNIQASKVTHINYAFANIAGGKCVLGDSYADTDKAFAGDTMGSGALRGNFNQLIKLREANPRLKTLISVGGWSWSGNFSAVAASISSRKAFVASCVKFMKQYKFDGIDIDWEFPVSGGQQSGVRKDKPNFTLLLKELRLQMDASERNDKREYFLSIAAPASKSIINNIEVKAVGNTVDWINLMTYDYHGSWETVTGHNSPMGQRSTDPAPKGLTVKGTLTTYLCAGVPASKLVLGVPFYGRGWEQVAKVNGGLFQSGIGAVMGTRELSIFEYSDIKANYLPTMKRYWDSDAQVPYLYDGARGLFISYDDPQSIKIKANYINAMGLGGAMIWDVSNDRDAELLGVLYSTLAEKPSPSTTRSTCQ